MRRISGRLSLTVVAVATALALPSLLLPGSGAAAGTFVAGLVMLTATVAYAARSLPPAQRRVWLPWCGGLAFAISGSALWQAGELLGRPALADVASFCWMAFYIPIAFTIIRIMRHRVPSARDRRTVLQDVAVATAAAAVFAWHVLIRPALGGGLTHGWWSLVQVVWFPLGDVLLLALGLTLVLVPGRRPACELYLLTGLGAALVVDVANALLTPSAFPGSWYMASYLVINAVTAAAVLHPSRVTSAQGTRPAATGLRRWRTFMLGAALSSVGVSSTLSSRHGWEQAPSAVAVVVMVTLILLRLHGAAAEAEAAHQIMRHEATHDRLTGLANRARLFEELRHAVPHSPTLFFVDLDGFKAINDTHGHHSGDEVLTAVAQRLLGVVRHGDTVARLGGDEFVVVCTGLAPADAAVLADRLEEAIAEPIVTGTGPVSVGASIGITSLRETTTDETLFDGLVTDLLHTADAAMYQAKRNGGGARQLDHAR